MSSTDDDVVFALDVYYRVAELLHKHTPSETFADPVECARFKFS
jgi:hypothetical protein